MKQPPDDNRRRRLFDEATSSHGAALQRLAAGYEADPERRRDLLQEIHLALWKSLEGFSGECSLRTWVYRIGHNVSINHAARDGRARSRMQFGFDEMQFAAEDLHGEEAIDSEMAMRRLMHLIHQLKMPERQIMLLYLDDVDGRTIAEVTGLSEGSIATRIHRMKKSLASCFQDRGAGE